MNLKSFFYPVKAAFYAAGSDLYLVYNYLSKNVSAVKKENILTYSDLSASNKNIENFNSNNKDFIEDFKKKGLLFSFSDYKEKKTEQIRNLAILTSGRPEQLKTALKSIIEKSAQKNRQLTLNVFDDSAIKENQIINRKISSTINNISGGTVNYYGIKEKTEFSDHLKKSVKKKGINQTLLDYAFYGDSELSGLTTAGANRNFIILKMAGEKIICIDDDVVYKPMTSKTGKDRIEISDNNIPSIFFSPEKKNTDLLLEETDEDLIDYISCTLGADTKKIINENENIYFSGLIPKSAYAAENINSRITAVSAGLYGGRWFSRPHGVLLNTGKYREKFFRKKTDYYKIKKAPFSVLYSDNLILSRLPFFTAAFSGVSLENPVPPFPPNGRNQDGIWASVMQGLDKYSFIGHLPFVLFHDYTTKKDYKTDDYNEVNSDFGLLTNLIIDEQISISSNFSPDLKYRTLGKRLVDLSELSKTDFINICQDNWLTYVAGLIEKIEIILDTCRKKPKHWVKDLETYMILIQKNSVKAEAALPKELKPDVNLDYAVKKYQYFFYKYGHLLQIWPEIWDSAMKIKKEWN